MFEQIVPPDVVDQHRSVLHGSALILQAIAMSTNLNPDRARAKGLHQIVGVTRVITEICDNHSLGMVAAINRHQRAGPGTSELVLRQLLELFDSHQGGLKRRKTTNDRGGAIMAAPDVMGDNERSEYRPGIGIIMMEYHRSSPNCLSR